MNDDSNSTFLERFAWLSIAAAIVTIALKAGAAKLTGSVGLLSDAMESVVNLVAAVVALIAIRISAKAPTEDYAHGREKAEYLSAGVEGTMIVLAAAAITVAAVDRLIHPGQVESLGVGLAVSALASLINLAVALVLIRAGTTHRSITLEADGKHLMTDVWTSGGVIVAMGLVKLTGWSAFDPIIAMGVAANIVVAGFVLVRRSIRGLLDASIPPEQRDTIEVVLNRFRSADVQFHALRTRQAGRRSFISFHVLVPGATSVLDAHDLVEGIEDALREALPGVSVTAHIEPFEDPRSYADEGLDPTAVPPSSVLRPRPEAH